MPDRRDPSWCDAAREPDADRYRAGVIGVWRSGVSAVEVFGGMAEGCAPVVRLTWGRYDAPRPVRVRDLDPELAADLAEVLDALSIHDLPAFAQALRAVGRALDC